MPLYNVTVKVAGSENNEYWVDVAGNHKNIEFPKVFILKQEDDDQILVTHVETIKPDSWSNQPRYSRISLFNITKRIPIDNNRTFNLQLDLPEPIIPTLWEHIEKHEDVEIVIGTGGSYYTEDGIVMNDGSEGWLKTGYPFKAINAETGNPVIVTSSSSEHRGGHGEGNITLTSLSITDLRTMESLPKNTVMKYSGITVRPIEVVDTEEHEKIKQTEVHMSAP